MKRNQQSTFPKALLLIIAMVLFNMPSGFAQTGPSISNESNKPLLHQKKQEAAINRKRPGRKLKYSGAIATVGAEDLKDIRDTYNLADKLITQKITYTANGVLKNSNTHIRIRGSKNQQLNATVVAIYGRSKAIELRAIYGNRIPPEVSYASTVITSEGNTPHAAQEYLKVMGGNSGLSYGPGAKSGTVNYTKGKELNGHFTIDGKYVPTLAVPEQNFNQYENHATPDWEKRVNEYFRNMNAYQMEDNSFERRGSVSVSSYLNDDFVVEEKVYRDANNTVRKVVDTEVYPEKYASQETTYFNCEGKPEYGSIDFTDKYGYYFNQLNIKYNTDNIYTEVKPAPSADFQTTLNSLKLQADYGYYTPFESTNKFDKAATFREYYNPKNNEFELHDILTDTLSSDIDYENYWYEQQTKDCYPDSSSRNIITFGIDLRLEDFGIDRKAFVGAAASYTRMFNNWVGGTVDAAVDFGKVNNTSFTVGSIHGGPTFIPFHSSLGIDDHFTLSLHTLAGYTNVWQKFGSNNNSFGNFSLKLGAGFDYNLNKRLGIRISADDNMVFGKGNTNNNFSFTGGVRLGFK